MGPKSRYVFAALLVLVSLMAIAMLAQAGPPTAAASTSADGLDGIQPLATIHCCGQGAADACRTECKAMGPGCKGQIGCRAGECVCTCTCP
jgi:hypothetical protein